MRHKRVVPNVEIGKDFNPGGARWCEEHQRLECTKNRSHQRGQCHQAARRGTDACRLHSGKRAAQHVVEGEARIRITAFNPHGEDVTIDASTAVMTVLQMSYLRLGMYSEMLRQQIAAEGAQSGDPQELDNPNPSGVIGFRYGMGGKDGITYVQSEEIRALVMLEATERDRVVKYAKTAHDMGISSQLISLAERWGDVVAGKISLMLEELGLTEDQARMVPMLLTTHLGNLDMAALGDGTEV
jgi:hypothetical protein